MENTNYKELCKEIFGTYDVGKIRKTAAYWKRQSTRNAGRKNALSDSETKKLYEEAANGKSISELAKLFCVTRQCISSYLNRRPGPEYTIRFDFKYGKKVCTVIYADFLNRKIAIRNRTGDILLRAFGVNETPDWEDFEYFVEDRCFPSSRGYLKQILQELHIDSYDPFSIIETTKGKTAEDNMYFTIRYYDKEITSDAYR